ncbi:hypothetical protein R1sor_009813 [Riccia sorocarpa]|uniref:Reverse transcriptase zinc-binding domain-containing protein n=1 Tax=Riccia sorocarpa TaxID=122646 RepID=A0ABD3HYY5_9MARC
MGTRQKCDSQSGATCSSQCRVVASLVGFCRKYSLDCISDLMEPSGQRKLLVGLERAIDPNDEGYRNLNRLIGWLQGTKLTRGKLQDSDGWWWCDGDAKTPGWSAPNKTWRKILSKSHYSEDALLRKWPDGGDGTRWQIRWKQLWQGKHTERNRIWFWRILWHAFFTGERAEKMRVSDGICARCERCIESTSHLFWQCPRVRPRWNEVMEMGRLYGTGQIYPSFLQTLDHALENQDSNPAGFLFVITHTRAIWRERNDCIFRGKNSRIPPQEITREVIRELEALGDRRTQEVRRNLIAREIKRLSVMVDRAELSQHYDTPQDWQREEETLISEAAEDDTDDHQSESDLEVGNMSGRSGDNRDTLDIDDSSRMSGVPEKEEIEAVIFGMKNKKAPRDDGLTVEVVKVCWEFVGMDLVCLVHTIWMKHRLLQSDMQAVIKLLPKSGDRKQL